MFGRKTWSNHPLEPRPVVDRAEKIDEALRKWKERGLLYTNDTDYLPDFCPNGHRVRGMEDMTWESPWFMDCKTCRADKKAERDASNERAAEKAKQGRDAERAKLGVGDPGTFDPSTACPKCGKWTVTPKFYAQFFAGVWLGGGHDLCDVAKGCPEGEHIHAKCESCGYWRAAACRDADRRGE